jgi:hypothetical protein
MAQKHGPADFLKLLAPQILAELRPPTEIKRFTRNPAVVGAYIETAVREFVRRQVQPLRVATGAVIDQDNIPGDVKLPQIDTIVWAPSPVPAVFQVGEFGLVPRRSAFGILEIKSSAYDIPALDKTLAAAVIKRATADHLPGEEEFMHGAAPGLGVVCLRAKGQSAKKLEGMTHRERVVVLFEEAGDKIVPRPAEVYRLVNFLGLLRMRGRLHEGQVQINIDVLKN